MTDDADAAASVVTIEPYMRHLTMVKIKRAPAPLSVVRVPRKYLPVTKAEPLSGGNDALSWSLHSSPPAHAGVGGEQQIAIVMQVEPIQTRKYGPEEWQWQACVSTGGVLSLLTNAVADRACPETNRIYWLLLQISALD